MLPIPSIFGGTLSPPVLLQCRTYVARSYCRWLGAGFFWRGIPSERGPPMESLCGSVQLTIARAPVAAEVGLVWRSMGPGSPPLLLGISGKWTSPEETAWGTELLEVVDDVVDGDYALTDDEEDLRGRRGDSLKDDKT